MTIDTAPRAMPDSTDRTGPGRSSTSGTQTRDGLSYEDYASVAPYFVTLRTSPQGGASHRAARDLLIELHLPLARNVARRFGNRGESVEDLTSVATVGLLLAIDRFDPDRGTEFLSFAIPTVMGEVRRYFRDHGWSMRVPRRLKEAQRHLATAGAELSQRLRRSPTSRELAAHLGWALEDVLDGLRAADAYRPVSLDVPPAPGATAPKLGDLLGSEHAGFEGVDNLQSLKPLIAGLADRDRAVLAMRFTGEMTQSEIAARIGTSQMQVSRILARILCRLREGLLAGA